MIQQRLLSTRPVETILKFVVSVKVPLSSHASKRNLHTSSLTNFINVASLITNKRFISFCLQDSSHWLIIGIKGFDQQCTDIVSSPQIYYSSRHNASISKFVALLKSPYLTYRARPRNSIRSKNIRAKQGNILSFDNGMQFTGRKLFLTDRHKLHGPWSHSTPLKTLEQRHWTSLQTLVKSKENILSVHNGIQFTEFKDRKLFLTDR